ncbi:hypothetical protein MBLNU13_g02405t1 [Cladosporium sp. NU13]
MHYKQKTLYLRVFVFFVFALDTLAGLEALLRAVRAAALLRRALCGLNNSGGGISSEVAIRPAQFSVYVLGGSVGFPEVLDLVPKVLKLGASSAVRSAVVLNIMSETLVVFVHLSINAAKAFVVKMKVLVVIFRASDLGFEGGVLCSRRAMHLLQVFEYFAEPSSTRTDLEAGVI